MTTGRINQVTVINTFETSEKINELTQASYK